MMQVGELTNGAILAIYQWNSSMRELCSAYATPVVQVLDIKSIHDRERRNAHVGNHSPRVRVTISDGTYMTEFGMLGSALYERYNNGELSKYCVLRIKKFSCNPHPSNQTKRVMVIFGIDMLRSGAEIGKRLGDPIVVNADGTIQERDNGTKIVATSSQVVGDKIDHGASKRRNEGSAYPPLKRIAPLHEQSALSRLPLDGAVGKQLQVDSSKDKVVRKEKMECHPIGSLTPYQQRWTIKARVHQKGSRRSFVTKQGHESKLFSITLGDSSGEIRATLFGKEVDRLFEVLEQGKVFYISNARLKPANKQFSQGIENDYEVTFTGDTTVYEAADDVDVPDIKFKFVPIGNLVELNVNTFVDVIGIVKAAGEAQHFQSKAQKPLVKREVELVEQSGQSVTFAMWGDEATNFDVLLNLGRVLAVKGARVGDYQGRTISTGFASTIVANPAVPETSELQTWYENGGSMKMSTSISGGAGNVSVPGANDGWKTLAAVHEERLGYGDRPDYFTNLFYITSINKDRMLYESCPNEGCRKKVTIVNGVYRCEKCKEDVVNVNYRLIPSINIADLTSSTFVTAFEEQAAGLLCKTGAEIGFLKQDGNGEVEIDKIVSDLLFSAHVMRIRVKKDNWNDSSRLNYSVARLIPMSEAEIARKMLADLRSMGVDV